MNIRANTDTASKERKDIFIFSCASLRFHTHRVDASLVTLNRNNAGNRKRYAFRFCPFFITCLPYNASRRRSLVCLWSVLTVTPSNARNDHTFWRSQRLSYLQLSTFPVENVFPWCSVRVVNATNAISESCKTFNTQLRLYLSYLMYTCSFTQKNTIFNLIRGVLARLIQPSTFSQIKEIFLAFSLP